MLKIPTGYRVEQQDPETGFWSKIAYIPIENSSRKKPPDLQTLKDARRDAFNIASRREGIIRIEEESFWFYKTVWQDGKWLE